MEKFDGYGEAQNIDAQLSALLEKHSITKENCLEWLNFARTIDTSAVFILNEATEVADGKSEFDVTIVVRVESKDEIGANAIGMKIADDLAKDGQQFVDRPINKAWVDSTTKPID